MSNKLVISLLLLLLIVSSWTLFYPNFFYIHDFVHGARIAEMARALSDGHFPVRWSSNFGFGYGMPLFEFYGPLPSFFGAVLYLLGFSLIWSVKTLILTSSIVTLVGAYLLGLKLYNKLGGVLLATLFLLAPYRAVNLFVRGAISEAWGMMTFPWILLGILLVFRKQKWGWLVLILSLVVLFLSHNLSSLMFVPFSLAFALLLFLAEVFLSSQKSSLRARFKFQVKSLARIGGCYLLAVGLSSFYLIPVFLEKSSTKVDELIVGGYFDYRLHFVAIRQLFLENWQYGGSSWDTNDSISFFLGYGHWIGLFILLGWLVYLLFKIKNQKSSSVGLVRWVYLVLVFLILWLVAVLLSSFHSQFIWERLPLLVYLQFPWRWLGVQAIFLATAVSSISVLITDAKIRRLLVFLLMAIVITTSLKYFRPSAYLANDEQFYYQDSRRIRTEMSETLSDYIPSQLNSDLPPTLTMLDSPLSENVEVLVDKTHQKLLFLNQDQSRLLTFNLAYFPGWLAEIDGQSTQLIVTKDGLMSVEVPAGEHLVGLIFGSTPVRHVADLMSGLSLLLILGLIVYGQRAKLNIKSK